MPEDAEWGRIARGMPQPSDLSRRAETEDSALHLCALRLPAHRPSQLPSLPPRARAQLLWRLVGC
ncbi:hypothetical protein MC885_014369, partial [Smutsia gigantea]